MSNDKQALLNEAISFELNIGKLYMFFAETFPDDHSFWWQLAKEEENHASLLRNGRDYYLEQGLFPEELLCHSLSGLRKIQQRMDEFYVQYRSDKPGIAVAANTALWLENSASELHYQQVMSGESGLSTVTIFQQLNGDDKDHADRIKIFMKKKGIEEIDSAQLWN